MLKRYQIELDRNERDFATFLKSREVTLSKTELRVLIASQAVEDRVSLFDITGFKDGDRVENLNKSRRLPKKDRIRQKEKHRHCY